MNFGATAHLWEGIRRMKKFFPILIILLFVSCKLISPDKDTTAPEIQLTIAGGNEISRGVTLLLDIEDDSKIDYVSVMIDDTTAITVESNFDTIRFDVTPFADESEHILYAKVADEEGNIGESEKIDVVITEYPGWRIYKDLRQLNWVGNMVRAPIVIDENGIVVIGTGWNGDGFHVFNPSNNEWQHYTPDNSPLPSGTIGDIKYIGDGRVHLASGDNIVQFSYLLNRWIYTIKLPNDSGDSNDSEIWALEVDKNYNVWAGTNLSGLFHYKGEILNKWYKQPEIPINRVYDIVISNDNIIYASTDGRGVFSIINEIVNIYESFSESTGDLPCIIIDSTYTVWTGGDGFAYKYNGDNWEYFANGIKFIPILVSATGTLYTFHRERGLVAWDGINWVYWNDFDSPFKDDLNDELFIAEKSLAEAPNGDIWMVAGGKLMRYRPSLGGYP